MKIINLILFIIYLINIDTAKANSKPVMCSSDWPLWETVRGMKALGLIPEFNFRYRDYRSCVNAFKQGSVDITFTTLYDFIFTQRYNQDAVIIAIQDYSSGGDKFYARNDIRSANDLKGKTILLQSNSISLWLAHLYLNGNGLSLKDVKIKELNGSNVGNQFLKYPNMYAGAVGWDPNFNMIRDEHGHVLVTSADFSENIFDVIAVKRRSLQTHKKLYQDFVDKWFIAIHQDEVTSKTANILKLDIDEYRDSLSNAYIYKSKADSLASFVTAKQIAIQIQNFFNTEIPKSVRRWATKEIFGNKSLDIERLFDESLLKDDSPKIDSTTTN